MLPRLIRVLVALFAGLMMSLAAPALALAHAHAHHELVEHSLQAHHGAHAIEGVATVVNDAQHDGHAHPVVDPGLLFRLTQLLPAVAVPLVTLGDFDAVRTSASAVPPVPFESPPDPVSTRPQQPRAPPAF